MSFDPHGRVWISADTDLEARAILDAIDLHGARAREAFADDAAELARSHPNSHSRADGCLYGPHQPPDRDIEAWLTCFGCLASIADVRREFSTLRDAALLDQLRRSLSPPPPPRTRRRSDLPHPWLSVVRTH